MRSKSYKDKRFITPCELSAPSCFIGLARFWTLLDAVPGTLSGLSRARLDALSRQARSALLMSLLAGIVFACTGCVRKSRTLNDNFYVLSRQPGAARHAAPDPATHGTTQESSDPASESLKVQVRNGARPKSLLSNVGILEEENSAISSLMRQAEDDPSNASVHFQLGRAYQEYRLYDEAVRHYQNALQLEPENPAFYEQMGRLWRDWQSPNLGSELVKKALELDPGLVEAWNTLGTIFDRQGRREEAQAAYLKALSLSPGLDYVHNNLCFSYLQSGNLEEAIRHGDRATHLSPGMLVAHNNLGLAYGALGDLDRALEEFKQSGDEATARNNLGLILLKSGQIAKSMEQFRLAARMRPHYKDAVANYWRARELKLQKERTARTRLRSFDAETGMEATPGIFGKVAITDIRLSLLEETLGVLFSYPTVMCPSLDGQSEI